MCALLTSKPIVTFFSEFVMSRILAAGTTNRNENGASFSNAIINIC